MESAPHQTGPFIEVYALLGAKTPLELSRLYSKVDQELMATQSWDYNNPELLTNRVKAKLETIDPALLTDNEKVWRNEILWFWNHHAISCAIWRYKDREAAQKYAEQALQFQSNDHPNKITRLFYFLTRDEVAEAEAWAATITKEPEKSTAANLITEYRNGELF